MFQVGEQIIYGSHGVCTVEDVGLLDLSFTEKGKEYYTLRPVYRPEAVLYVPVDNTRIVMRPICTKEEAEHLIEEIPQIESEWVLSEREREQRYKQVIQTCDPYELVRIIKTLTRRKETRLNSGKKVPVVDERYFRKAEEQLYGELALALDMERGKVGEYVTAQFC